MYRYVKAASPLKSVMSKLKSKLSSSLKELFTSAPKFQKVKDPDTGVIGQLYQYECASGAQLAVEMYPYPLEEGKYSVRAYVIDDKGDIVDNTIKILNPSSGNSFKPIPQNKLMQYITQYADDNFELLGSFEDADDTQTDIDDMNDDGFEPSQYDENEESEDI